MVTILSGEMRTKALITLGVLAAAAIALPAGRWKASTRPAPPTVDSLRKPRRPIAPSTGVGNFSTSRIREAIQASDSTNLASTAAMGASINGVAGCGMDRGADAGVTGAAAHIAGHGAMNVGIRGLGLLAQKRRGIHDLARLAIAALRHVHIDPGLLQGMEFSILRQAFDGGDFLVADLRNRRLARPHRRAVDMYGAGAAGADAAAIFCAHQPEMIAQHPQQGCSGIDIVADDALLAIHLKTQHAPAPLFPTRRDFAADHRRLSRRIALCIFVYHGGFAGRARCSTTSFRHGAAFHPDRFRTLPQRAGAGDGRAAGAHRQPGFHPPRRSINGHELSQGLAVDPGGAEDLRWPG